MTRLVLYYSLSALMILPAMGCATNRDDRQPAGYSRAGREYKEPRAMNHRRIDTDALYEACLRERSETICRNRMGR